MLLLRPAFLLFIGAILSAPVPAQAKRKVVQLRPSSNWHVNYSDDSCRLARQFGEGAQTATLIMDQFGPGQRFSLTLAGSVFKPAGGSWSSISLKFGPSENAQEVPFFFGSLGKLPAFFPQEGMRIASPSKLEQKALSLSKHFDDVILTPIGADRIAAVTELDIDGPLKHPVRLFLGSMTEPFSALDRCIDELLTHWGVDPEKFTTQSRPLKFAPKIGELISEHDYPLAMLSRGTRAMVYFRLSVDATGLPTACHVQQSTGPKVFDDTVCRVFMRRARFEPALDVDGKPFASVYQQSVAFVAQ